MWMGIAVVSHWILDWVTHRPDLPLVPGYPTKVGLGLWNSLPATVIIESTMFAAGVAIYLSATPARDRMGRINIWVYVAGLSALYAGNLWGPLPPSPNAIAIAGLGLWLFPCWAAWIDHHRVVRAE